MRELTVDCLDDARVVLVMDDVAMLIDTAQQRYDAILLDVGNGPSGLTRQLNDGLYSRTGLQAAMADLRQNGLLAIWSAEPELDFVAHLENIGFQGGGSTRQRLARRWGASRHLFAEKP